MQIITKIVTIFAVTIFKHVSSLLVNCPMPSSNFKPINVNCLFNLCSGTKNKNCEKIVFVI